MTTTDTFLKALKRQRHTDTLFNPYRTERLVRNLRCYLEHMRRQGPNPILLVGEAPGYKGGALTGIPFSSGDLFRQSDHPFLTGLKDDLDIRIWEAENTASMVWRDLVGRPAVPLFWNAFPYHPHRPGDRHSNRPPSQREVHQGAVLLQMVHDLFQPRRVAGIGRKGRACAQATFPDRDIAYIRHPSFGGKSEFVAGMDRLFERYGTA